MGHTSCKGFTCTLREPEIIDVGMKLKEVSIIDDLDEVLHDGKWVTFIDVKDFYTPGRHLLETRVTQ